MKTDQATEQLQTIRTLMERSALYRRALAPLMTFAGGLGILAAFLGYLLRIETATTFTFYWYAVALIGLAGSLLLVRRQAIKTSEPFWSPPTRRVAQAILPALVVGFLLGACFYSFLNPYGIETPTCEEYHDHGAGMFGWVTAVWGILYGCGLHAAGFFTSRGLRRLGWLFIAVGSVVLFWMLVMNYPYTEHPWWHSHVLMGVMFGGMQLAYGIYLYVTGEEQNTL